MTTIESVGQIAIAAKDLDRARAFYRDTLGLKHLFDAPPGLTFFQCGSIRLLVEVPADERFRHPASVLYYKVADIDAAHADLVAKGVRVEGKPHLVAPMPDHDLWMAFYRDSEDNVFSLMCEKRK
ncbi:VOC family protein [Usitatibacter palustris]|uniref:VOC domain-containing protein n=1 Tax=Usitatibacter palustris TaxID=2732487 RepID=A0A6M4H916_9PROT|nr:VOC family protein [Usitatibacter palustris]QJR15223.1 hypothetical protein DSM104440_02040 [Usitatibacter palustris]